MALINSILSYTRRDSFHKYTTNFRFDLSRNPKTGPDLCCTVSLKAIQLSYWFSTHLMMCLVLCHDRGCDEGFNCDCRRSITSSTHPKAESQCIKFADVCDGTPNCSDKSDEVDCFCSIDQFQCSGCERGQGCKDPFYCIPRANVGDGRTDCRGKDEET